MNTPEPLDRLAQALSRLPGVGRRSAERMAFYIARDPGPWARELVAALQEVAAEVGTCSRCGGLTLRAEDPCRLCTDPRRDGQVLCVVEDAGDIQALERAGAFRGRYHALAGKLSPMRGQGMGNLRIDSLLERLEAEGIQEVILALGSDVESDATAAYLGQVLAGRPVRLTRLASGMPVGSEIAYSDPVTLARSFQHRGQA